MKVNYFNGKMSNLNLKDRFSKQFYFYDSSIIKKTPPLETMTLCALHARSSVLQLYLETMNYRMLQPFSGENAINKY